MTPSIKDKRLIIAVKVGDNDFWSIFHCVLNHIYQLYLHNGSCDFAIEHTINNKEWLVNFINKNLALYLDCGVYSHGDRAKFLKEYLRVTSENVYLGDEAIKYLDSNANWNYDCFVLDTGVYDQRWKVYSK